MEEYNLVLAVGPFNFWQGSWGGVKSGTIDFSGSIISDGGGGRKNQRFGEGLDFLLQPTDQYLLSPNTLQARYDVGTNPEPILSVQGRTNPEPLPNGGRTNITDSFSHHSVRDRSLFMTRGDRGQTTFYGKSIRHLPMAP